MADLNITTSYAKLYEHHRKRFPKVSVLNNYNEFKDTAATCLCELLNLEKDENLENSDFWREIDNFVNHIPTYYKKKKGNKSRMFGAHKEYFSREFNIQLTVPDLSNQGDIPNIDSPPPPAVNDEPIDSSEEIESK